MNKDKNDLTGRRDFFKTAAGTIGAVAVSSSFTSFPMVSKEESETLKIGYLPITDAAPLLIAHARGYFREEGLKVKQPLRVRSWSTLAESFLAGKFNITHMLLPMPVWMRYNSSIPVKILAWNHTNGSAITVRGNSGIKGFADLEGKQVAVPYWYSMHNVILQMGLKKVGLKPVIRSQSTALKPGEVNLFILPPSEMPAALFGGKIDGYIVAEPFNAIAELKINARIMRFTGDIWKNHPCCVVVMKESLIRSRPVFIQKVMNAIVRAQLWMTHNPKKAAKILSREGDKYLPIPENVLLRVFTVYDFSIYGDREIRERHEKSPTAIQHPGWGIGRIGFQPYPYPSATRFIVKEMRHTLMEGNTAFLGKLDPDFAAGDLVDDSFVKRAIDAVGGPGKFEAIDIQHPWTREEVIEL